MTKTIAQNNQSRQKPFSKDLRAKLYPNGECSIYVCKTKKVEKPHPDRANPNLGWFKMLMMAIQIDPGQAEKFLSALGLSDQTNSDSPLGRIRKEDVPDAHPLKRYGSRGITSYGARRIRCGAHMLQKTFGKNRVIFATATVPGLPIEHIERLQQSWHQVVETYRRKLTRELRKNNLRGEIVTVSEVQEERYEDSGVPVLHLHSIWCNKDRAGKWVITPELHDEIWADSLCIAGRIPIGKLSSACKLERIRKSAEGYLGKYMSKGTKVIRKMIADGFDGWFPKQWWSCSRSLSQRIDKETRDVSDIAQWLDDIGDVEGGNVWVWKHDVYLEFEDGFRLRIARYGRLRNRITAEIQMSMRKEYLGEMAY